MDTISDPILDNLITKAQSHPDLLNQVEKDALLSIIEKLQCVAICGNDERRELWLTVECGSIEDFGDYNEYLENEVVVNKDEFEKIWKEEYFDPIKCYLLLITHYDEEYFIFIDNKLTLHIKNIPSDNNELISWIDEVVNILAGLKEMQPDTISILISTFPFQNEQGVFSGNNIGRLIQMKKNGC